MKTVLYLIFFAVYGYAVIRVLGFFYVPWWAAGAIAFLAYKFTTETYKHEQQKMINGDLRKTIERLENNPHLDFRFITCPCNRTVKLWEEGVTDCPCGRHFNPKGQMVNAAIY